MKIIVHTKYGKFETKSTPYSEKEFQQTQEFMQTVTDCKFLSLNTENGFIYIPQELIQNTLFEIDNEI